MRRLGLLVGLLWCLAYADSYQPLLNHERMTQLFIEMATIESGSENEAAMCEFVAKQLRELGAETVIIDEASKQIGGTGGNVFARFKGTVNAPPLLLNAHVDTVYSTEGIQLIRDENEIRTDGKTILGADNKAGVAIILEVIRTLKERSLPHPPLEVVFTIREEKGLLGAKGVRHALAARPHGAGRGRTGRPQRAVRAVAYPLAVGGRVYRQSGARRRGA
jgi:tripeptide aminopeptidase